MRAIALSLAIDLILANIVKEIEAAGTQSIGK